MAVATRGSLSRAKEDASYRRRDEPGIWEDDGGAMDDVLGVSVKIG